MDSLDEETETPSNSDLGLFNKSIKAGRLREVKKFLRSYPSLSREHADVESAVAKALKSKQFSVYKLLISEGFRLGQHEEFETILRGIEPNAALKNEIRETLRKIHIECVKPLKPDYLYTKIGVEFQTES